MPWDVDERKDKIVYSVRIRLAEVEAKNNVINQKIDTNFLVLFLSNSTRIHSPLAFMYGISSAE